MLEFFRFLPIYPRGPHFHGGKMQVPSAALEGAAQGNAIGTKMVKKANELQAQELDVLQGVTKQTPSLPGMGGQVDVSA